MEPGDNEPQPRGGAPRPSAGAVLMVLVVAALVAVIVDLGGGVSRPLTTSAPRVSAAQTAQAQG